MQVVQDQKPASSDKPSLSVELPNTVPKPKAEEQKPKKKRGRKREHVVLELSDIQVPAGLLFLSLTKIIAAWKNDDRLIAETEEIGNVEEGVNEWIRLRAPLLKSVYPELVLLMPIAAYGMRIASLHKKEKKSE